MKLNIQKTSPFQTIGVVLGTGLVALASSVILGVITLLVWNVLAPLTHLPLITFWQGVAINIVLAVSGNLLKSGK